MKSFLTNGKVKLSFHTLMELFTFHKVGEVGSNDYRQCEELICEFELFVAGMFNDNHEVKPEELLSFVTGSSSIPLQGFEKKTDIHFDDVSLPKASTCGLVLTLPRTNIVEKLKIALTFAGGFGDV